MHARQNSLAKGRLSFLAAVVLAFASGGGVIAKQDKVDICHMDDDGNIRLINVSKNAVEGHLSHGDHLLEDSVFYEDADGDGHGNIGKPIYVCTIPQDYVDNADDCDDTDPFVIACSDCGPCSPEDCAISGCSASDPYMCTAGLAARDCSADPGFWPERNDCDGCCNTLACPSP